MAVTGVFNADFSQFFGAVTEANGKLASLDANTTQTSAAVKGLESSFGASGAKLRDLGAAAATVPGPVNSVSDAFKQFDGALAAVGIHIGPQVKALEDLAGAAGKTVGELGGLTTAGLAVGAAMAGWQLGRMVSEFLGLDKAISDATVSLMGWNSTATETAGAKQDTINRAIAQGAKETISYTDAIKFNIEAVKQHADAQINWTQKLADAYKEVRGLNDATKEEIAIAQEAGATTEQLTNKYGLSSTALGILAKDHRDAAKATDEHREKQEALNKAAAAGLKDFEDQTNAAKAWQPVVDDNIKKRDDAAKKKSEDDAAALQAAAAKKAAGEAEQQQNAELAAQQKDIDAALQQAQKDVDALGKSHTEAGAAAAAGTSQAVQGYQAAAQQITITGDAIKEYINLMRYTAQANAILGEGHLFTTQSQRDRIAGLPSFAGGVENFEGGVAKVHEGELLVNLPGGTSVIPKGQGGNVTMSNTFHLVDSESNLARRVSELIMRSVRAGTQLGTT